MSSATVMVLYKYATPTEASKYINASRCKRPTMCAADGGESARFKGMFLALS